MGVHHGIYKSSYNISNISYFYSPPPSFSFITPSPIPGTVSKVLYFFIYILVHTVYPYPFSSSLLLPLVPTPSRQSLFSSLVLPKNTASPRERPCGLQLAGHMHVAAQDSQSSHLRKPDSHTLHATLTDVSA
jgi:hypothetical protein